MIRVSRCQHLCPHIVIINGVHYWVTKVRKDHPIAKGMKGRCHHCKKEISDSNIVLPTDEANMI